jgi:uncharacterized membrane protein
VDPAIIALVAFSAILHVAWNVRLKTAGDPLRAATVGMIAGSVVIVPVGAVIWAASGWPTFSPAGVGLGLVSGVVEAGYFILLAAAYRRGDLSVVYPIARGTAPLLAVAIGILVFGERLGLSGSAGVAALIAGFLVLQRPWRVIAGVRTARSARASAGDGMAGGSAGRPAAGGIDTSILFALATGVTIATYSAIDRMGTRLVDPFVYGAILTVTSAVVLVAWVMLVAGGGVLAGGRAQVQRAAVGGMLTLVAYLCILVALSVAPLSGVSPLRESATVFAAAWGSVRLREAASGRETARRIGASVLIVAGALLLALGGE